MGGKYTAQEMREALEEISREIWESIDPFCNDDCCKPKRELAKIADAALASLPRNCDRPECATTEEAQDVWRKEDGGKTAYYEWLLTTATKSVQDSYCTMGKRAENHR